MEITQEQPMTAAAMSAAAVQDKERANAAAQAKNVTDGAFAEDFDQLVEPPIIDVKVFLEHQQQIKDGQIDSEESSSVKARWEIECKKVAASFNKFGICIVRDPRVVH